MSQSPEQLYQEYLRSMIRSAEAQLTKLNFDMGQTEARANGYRQALDKFEELYMRTK